MDALDYWRLCDELSVVQAALLISGIDPATCQNHIDGWESYLRPEGYEPAFAALKHAINAKRLKAIIKHSANYEHFYYQDDESVGDWTPAKEVNWHLTTVAVDDLKRWLLSRGFQTGFFFPEAANVPNYLDSHNSYYAPKLAAAVRAWEATTLDGENLKGKTPKQRLEKWLRENAGQYGLTKEDGNPNEQGIEQISKVANWKPEGGAAKTPANSDNLTTPQIREKH